DYNHLSIHKKPAIFGGLNSIIAVYEPSSVCQFTLQMLIVFIPIFMRSADDFHIPVRFIDIWSCDRYRRKPRISQVYD
ncbi:hypothetical protein ACGU0V_005166, partial [Serratia marcescens]